MRPMFVVHVLAAGLLLAGGASPIAAQVGATPAGTLRDTMRLVVPGDGHLNFIAMGDWGRDGEPAQRAVARAMADVAKAIDADFLLVLGDNFYPNGVQSVSDPQWRRSLEDVYTMHPLNVDWYVALGNHDYRGDPVAQLEYAKVSRRWRMPSRYYSVTKRLEDVPGTVTAQFLIIDTSPFIQAYRLESEKYSVAGTDTAAQRRWIDRTLAASTARWKFIVGHHHVYSAGGRPVMADMEGLLLPLMKKHRVAAYLSGHEHHLEHAITADGVHLLISGAASEGDSVNATARTRFAASGPGFLALSLGADSLLIQAVNERGELLYRASLRR